MSTIGNIWLLARLTGKLSIISIVCPNNLNNREMLSGKENENGDKTTIGLISKKATFHLQHTFLVHFFAVVLHDLHVLWRKCRASLLLFLFTFFLFYCRSFSPRWPLAFLIECFHSRGQHLRKFIGTKKAFA